MACNGSDDLSHARTRCPAFSRFHWQHYADQAVLFVQSGVYFPINELASPCVAPDQDDCARTSCNMLVGQAPAYVVHIVAIDRALRGIILDHVILITECPGKFVVPCTIAAVMVADKYLVLCLSQYPTALAGK